MNKNSIKKITSMRLFLPIVCLVAVLLVNLITTPGFFKISINNGVLYGYIVDVVNRAFALSDRGVDTLHNGCAGFLVDRRSDKKQQFISLHQLTSFGLYGPGAEKARLPGQD